MKRDVWIVADNIVSPLGLTTRENYKNISAGKSGISLLTDTSFSKTEVHAGAMNHDATGEAFTRFESISIYAAREALKQTNLDFASSRTLFILSTTKGNIELLEEEKINGNNISLHESASNIANSLGIRSKPLVVSNACISGVMATLVARRLIQAGLYDHAIITGADVLTKFVLSGFQSLSAISTEACKPFDAKRKGVTLGEAAATVILTSDPETVKGDYKIKILGGSVSNDANHISGPSRTGEELAQAVNKAIEEARVSKGEIDFISAHGTATVYNDEMEARAFNHVGLAHTPLNSLKGYFGHTLGAAGIVETIVSIHALLNNELIPTFGFEELGVSQSLNVIRSLESKKINTCLKTASGFGGCNAALVIRKA